MRRGIVGFVAASSAIALLGLAGCTSAAPEQTSTPTARAASTPTPTPTPTPITFLGTGVSLRYSCDELVGPAVINSLGRNLSENRSYQPAATTSAERAVAIGGTACEWNDPRTGNALIVTAAHPDLATLSAIRASTSSYAQPTTLLGTGVSGFIVNTQVEIFTRNGYWATATSPLFNDPKIVRSIMDAVESALPAG